MILGVLLYGAESWAIKEPTIGKIEKFHNRFMSCILGISRAEQKIRHLTTAQFRMMFGMEISIKDLLSVRRVRWLDHTSRMSGERKLLFGWLPKTRPVHGAKLRWRDKVRQDLEGFTIPESDWYCLCEGRITWRGVRQEGLQRV